MEYSNLSKTSSVFKAQVFLKLKQHHDLLMFTQSSDFGNIKDVNKQRKDQLISLHCWINNQHNGEWNFEKPEYNFCDLEIAALELMLLDGDLDILIYN